MKLKLRIKRVLATILALAMTLSVMSFQAFAKSVSVTGVNVSIKDTANSISVSGGVVTATAKGSLFSKKTNTITITNESGNTARLSVTYTTSACNSFKINDAAANASGTYTENLAAGGAVKFAITSNSGLSNTTATLKLSDFSLIAAAETSTVTVSFDENLGSVTAGGSAVTDGSVLQDVTLSSGVALVATPASGATFHGWVDDNGLILSTSTTYTLKPAGNMTVKAVLSQNDGTPVFGVGGASQKSQSSGLLGLSKLYYYTVTPSYLFDNLNEAAAFAGASNNKAIVLMNSGILPAGDYTIPAGVTLLIPFDSANTLYTTESVGKDLENEAFVEPTPFRKLTMEDGANLTVNGAISLSANHRTAQGNKDGGGSPYGPTAFVQMDGGSTITVNDGGALYCYGYITGSGSVEVNDGGVVYENFQIMDFRGGTQSTDMDHGVFPLSQYYVQNIEVPMTLHYGAKEYAATTIAMSGYQFHSAVAFIAPQKAMFNLSSGYVEKDYDETTDRLVVAANGDLIMSPINMTVGTSSINSKNYVLGINGNISMTVKEGSTITIEQNVALLPGAEIVVRPGAECVLASGINLYIYDADQWGNYCGAGNKIIIPVTYAPGRMDGVDRSALPLEDASIQLGGTLTSSGYIYTTKGGASITGMDGARATILVETSPKTVTYQLVQGTGYTKIPIDPAKLKNADGNYFATAGLTATKDKPATLAYADGVWTCVHTYWNAATYTWADDGKTCTAKHVCANDNIHEEVAVATITSAVKNPATCTEKGTTTYTATFDGVAWAETQTKDIQDIAVQPEAHTIVVDAAVAVTCTTAGKTEGKHCSACNEVLVAQTEIPAAHTYGNLIKAKDEIHTQTELKGAVAAHYFCDACDTYFTEGKVATTLEALTSEAPTHTPVVDAAVAPTCTTAGKTEGKHCSVCNVILIAQEEISATNHDWNDPTYTWAEDGKTCTAQRVCGNNAEHVETESAIIADEVKIPATCTEKGTTTYTATFTEAWATTQTKDVKDIPATNHSWSVTYSWIADGSSCIATHVCAHDATHNEIAVGTITSEKTKEPTCGTNGEGITTYYASFDAAWATGSSLPVADIPAQDHAWNDSEWVSDSNYHWHDCDTNATHKKDTEAHAFVVDTDTDGNAKRYCSVCKYEDNRLYRIEKDEIKDSDITVDLQDKGYNSVEKVETALKDEVEAISTGTGKVTTQLHEIELQYKDGDDWIAADEEHFPDNGQLEIVIQAPADTSKYNFYVVHMFSTNAFNKTAGETETFTEDDGSLIVENGYLKFAVTGLSPFVIGWECKNHADPDRDHICNNGCGESIGEHADSPTDTDHVCDYCRKGKLEDCNWGTTTYTWANDGSACIAKRVCSINSDHIETATSTITSAVKTPASCTEKGNTTYTATFDVSWAEPQTKDVEDIPASNHTNKHAGEAKDATCTEAGHTAGEYCPDCETWLTEQEEIPATNHANKYAGEAKEASCTEAGHTAGEYCPDCETWLTEQEELPATNHANKYAGEAKDATCTEVGHTAGAYCPDCQTWLEAQEEIPATNHANKYAGEAKDATCTEAGHTAGVYCPDCETWLTAQEEIPASGHTDGEAVIENEGDGSYDNVVYCAACGEELSRETIITTGGSTTGGTTTGGTTTGGTTTGGTTTGGTTTGGTTTGGTTTGGTTTGGTTTGGTTTGGTTTGGTTTGGTTTGGTTTGGTATGGTTTGGTTTGGTTTGGTTTGGTTTGGTTTGGSTTGGTTTGGSTTGGSTTGGTTTGNTFELGDADHDGVVNSDDAVAILRNLAGYEVPNFYEDTADFNGDGKADSDDAVAILRKLAGY